MLMVTSRLPAFIQPVVILRGRKLSFKQLGNGTVVIGGGHLATPYRDRNETVLDWDKLAISAAHGVGAVPGDAPGDHRARLGRHRGAHARRHPRRRAERTSEGVFHQFGFSAHGFQLGPGTGAVMAELVATGSTNVPIADLAITRFKLASARDASRSPAAGSARRPRRPRDRCAAGRSRRRR